MSTPSRSVGMLGLATPDGKSVQIEQLTLPDLLPDSSGQITDEQRKTIRQRVQQIEPGHFSHLSLEEYTRHMGGSRPISRVLIANNGIAAVKAIRSIRKWAYETFSNDKIIQFVAMATPEDLRANAEYIHLADEFVPVPGGSNNNNYANIRLITEIAENTNCHAVWAGWGHASENPKLPDLLAGTKSKIVWIGPPSHAMRALGDKIGSTLIAQSAGVPCMPWSGDGLLVNYAKSGIPDDIYQQSCVDTVEQAQIHADRIGYPVMLKASEGGGGKGIRRVEKAQDLAFAFRQVQGEVPGSPIFLMKLAGTCRHLEVQLLCDQWGGSIAIFGRDCSIQRRHQKIIEEGPVVAAPAHIWEQMEKSAVRLAKEVGYVGAGTVEYLYMEDGSYSFLELNPRLQVEHPVTELISGVNLPAAQLQIAMGIPLKRLPGIRKMYGESPLTDTDIDFDTRKAQTLPLHVIACRITAENPDEKFQPTSGVIQELNFRSTPDVWGYFSVNAKGLVHEFADSQFGHMFAVGPTREIARKNMVLALKELEIRGEIRTTIEYLRVMIEHEEFKQNKISTMWLEGILANHSISAEQPSNYLAVVCGALFRAHTYAQQQETDYTNSLLKGHLPGTKVYHQLVHYDCDLIHQDTKYKLQVTKSGPTTYDLTLLTPSQPQPQPQQTKSLLPSPDPSRAVTPVATGSTNPTEAKSPVHNESSVVSQAPTQWTKTVIATCDIHNLSDGGYLVLLNGKKHVIHGREFPSGLRLSIDTMTCLFQHEYDPTALRSETQGKLVQFLIENGAHVNKGDPVAELEVMKMYITIRAPESGHISHVKNVGTVVESGDVLANFRLDNPDCVKKATLFNSVFPEAALCQAPTPSNLAEQLRTFDLRLRRLLSGYIVNPQLVTETIANYTTVLGDSLLPAVQFHVLASNAAGRVPSPLLDRLIELVDKYQSDIHAYNLYLDQKPNKNVSLSSTTSPLLLTSTLLNSTQPQADELFGASSINTQPVFPVKALTEAVDEFLKSDSVNIVAVKAALDQYGITSFFTQYQYGVTVNAVQSLFSYIYEFLTVEESFQLPTDFQVTSITTPSLEDVLHHLRKVHKDNLSYVSSLARAHNQFSSRCAFISLLVDTLLSSYATTLNSTTAVKKSDLRDKSDTTIRDEWTGLLHRLASLHEKDAIVVSLKARQALVSLRLPSQKTRLYTTMRVLESALEKRLSLVNALGGQIGGATKTVDEDKLLSPMSGTGVDPTITQATNAAAINDLIDQSQPIDDVILHFLSHPSDQIRALAAEAYVRRAFQYFNITNLNVFNNPTMKQLIGNLDEEHQQHIFGQTPQLLTKWEFFMEQKGTQSTADNSGHVLSPVSILSTKSHQSVNGMRRVDSLSTLAHRSLSVNPSADVSASQTPQFTTETDSEEDSNTAITPDGMCLQSPTITPESSLSSIQNVPTTTSNAVKSEFPAVSSTLKPVRRMGVLAHFNSIEELRSSFSTILAAFHDAPQNKHLPRTIRNNSSLHVLYVYITSANHSSVQALSDDLQPIVAAYQGLLTQHKIRRITFVVPLLKPDAKKSRTTSSLQFSSMTPVFAALPSAGSSLMAQLSLPTPASLALKPANNSTVVNAMSSEQFLANSIVVSPSYVTFRCANIETGEGSGPHSSSNAAITTPMAKHLVSLSKPVEFIEDKAIRQIEPNNALHLQLDRMSGYDYHLVPTSNRVVHLFAAIPNKPTAQPPVPTSPKTQGVPATSGGPKSDAKPTPVPAAAARAVYDGRRFFARVLVRRLNSVLRSKILNGKAIIVANDGELDVTVPSVGTADSHPETEVAFVDALNSLEIALTTANALQNGTSTPSPATEVLCRPGGNGKWLFNHIFVNVLVDVNIEMAQAVADRANAAAAKAANTHTPLLPDETLVNIDYVDSIIRSLTRRYADKIRRLHITHVEFAITLRVKSPLSNEINSVPIRFICENPSSLVLHISPFYEQYDPITNKVLLVPIQTRSLSRITYDKFKTKLFSNPSLVCGADVADDNDDFDKIDGAKQNYLQSIHGYTDADAPYPVSFPYQKQRLLATSMETIWCYDFKEIFEKAVRRSWRTTLLSYVNVFSELAFIQQPGKAGATISKKEQQLAMTVLFSVLSIMFNYTDITLQAAARSLRALIQAPLSVFRTAGISLILANSLSKDPAVKPALEQMVEDSLITVNEFNCIQQISTVLPQLPLYLFNIAAEFAQIAIRIPITFIRTTELTLTHNPGVQARSGSSRAEQYLTYGFSGYSQQYTLTPIDRAPGLNEQAMVAFDVTLYTPECLQYQINLDLQPRGDCSRKMILIANDITFEAGSFGTKEDMLFDLASKRAREQGIPRIYLAANSGARIGLADELKGKFKIAFIPGDEDYSKGSQYIYLTPKVYQEFQNSVVCEKVTVDSTDGQKEDRYIITDIIGKKSDLGVENLRGSGCIAGETSQAYQDIFTLTYVTCRSVGIGAYLARLGQRVIQKADPAMPLLLTGYQALNKLLGKTVYTSNIQLGGPEIMYTNGVSHQIVSNDLQGCCNIIQWLSYVPKKRLNRITDPFTSSLTPLQNSNSFLAQTIDPVNRSPTFTPATRNQMYDPRHLLVGTTTHNPVLGLFQQFITFQERLKQFPQAAGLAVEQFPEAQSSIPLDDIGSKLSQSSTQPITSLPQTGLFDQFSFMEVLGGWAKGVVTGRARLGGIPVGVICVDTRTIEQTIPADPALSESNETVVSRAGQVWFPESSYKTAQAIFDLKAEDLPIVILANWRGFSGGMQDMLNEILKFGSYIVDALHAIQQPILVYLPPMSTLRGGAWVVIDPTINFDFMEMYADTTARGGVLEPEGIVDVKFRRDQILTEMRRCDPLIIQYNQQLTVARAANDTGSVGQIQALIKSRETALYPVYLQLATHFADLHDTPVRMQHKGCLNDVTSWSTARQRFFYRIKAKQLENQFVNSVLALGDKQTGNTDIYLNVAPNSSTSYQHNLLWSILTQKYKLTLEDRNTAKAATSTHASTIQLARGLVSLWFAELHQFVREKSVDLPPASLPSTIPSFSHQLEQDQTFVQFLETNLTKAWFKNFITAKLTELDTFKAKSELLALKNKFSKKELLAMLDSME